jgi:Fe(3+) dicitrate transport protein
MKLLLTTLFNILIFNTIIAQQGTIKGSLMDNEEKPIVGALVSLKGTVRQVETNDKGEFLIKNIQYGTYIIEATYLGYEAANKEITLNATEPLNIEMVMKELVYSFNEVHVTATRLDGRNLQEVDGFSINATKKNELVRLDKIDANLAMNNPRQIFSKVPGISVWESDGSGIQMSIASRGLSPNRSWEFNTRLNGYDITPDPMGYPEAYYTPPTEVVEKIEIVRGASSLQYGPQFGGLLNFVLRKPDISKKFTFETQNTLGSNGLFSTFNYIGGTEGRLNYTAYYQKRSGDGWRENSAFNTDHAHATFNYAVTEKLKLGAEITYMDYVSQQAGGLTDTLYKANAQKSLRSRNWFAAPWLVPAVTAEYTLSAKTKFSFKTFGTLGERNSIGFVKAINVADDNGNRQIDRDFYKNIGSEIRVLTNFTLLGKDNTVAAGLRYFNGNTDRKQVGTGDNGKEYNTTLLPNTDYSRDLSFRNINYAAFAENLLRINNKLLVTFGTRVESINSTSSGRIGFKDNKPIEIGNLQRNRNFMLFGAGIEYHTTPNQEFYTNISQAYRPVLFSDLTPPATTDVIDENLKDAKGFNFDFGYRGRIGKLLTFDVDYFHLVYSNRIGTISKYDNQNKVYQYRTNLGESTSKGYEAYVELKPFSLIKNNKIGQLTIFTSLANINATYGDFKVTSTANGVISEKNLAGNQVENAPKNINRYGLTYAYKTASITWQLSDISETFADANNTIKANAAATAGIIPAYKIQDLSASIKFKKYYNIKTGINNLTNTKYFTRRAGGYPGPGVLPADGRTYYLSVGLRI